MPPTGRGRSGPSRGATALAGCLFVAPQLVGTLVFVLLPLVLVVWYTLHEWNVLADTFKFTGARQLRAAARRPEPARRCCGPPALFSVGLVVLNLSLALLLAVLLNQKLRGHHGVPHAVLLAGGGLAGGLDHRLGLPAAAQRRHQRRCSTWSGIEGPNWLRGRTTAMLSVIVVQVFKNVGLNMVLFLAALQGVPRELYEAARIDGAAALASGSAASRCR